MEYCETKKYVYYLSEAAFSEYYGKYFNVQEGRQYPWHIFVLINRKGYWDYKIFFPDGIDDQNGQRKVMSGRYLDKCPLEELRELFRNKNVIIYDDSLSNGSNLFYFFCCAI